ncbi:C40 family peptidase [Amphibiibacter pelophylacis]|uniref:C40 family peptidase n=1 Tax=Amphibiibacter pelophylacis TaxID=1799477 RepID=A0ACC6P1D0_9BURK
MVHIPFPASASADPLRRQALQRSLLVLGSAVLAGCASSPVQRRSGSGTISGRVPEPSRLGGSLITLPGSERGAVVQTALQQLGVPYVWAGTDPANGFDCSGLMVYSFRAALGVDLPRQSADLAAVSRPIDLARAQPGDFVFFNTLGRPFSHLGLYLGSGEFIHAPSSGGRVSRVRLDNRYFAPRFNGARTVFV